MNVRTLGNALMVAGLALAIPLGAQARPMMMEGQGARECPMQMGKYAGQGMRYGGLGGLRGLDLSETQSDQIFALMHAQAPLMREQAKLARNAQRELQALTQAATFDLQRAKELADASALARSEMIQMRARNQHAVMRILTPEQRQMWLERTDRSGTGEFGPRRGGGDSQR